MRGYGSQTDVGVAGGLKYVWSQETQVITTLRDAPHQHKSRFGHKVLTTSTVCEQSKSECSIIDQRPNIIGAGHGVKIKVQPVQENHSRDPPPVVHPKGDIPTPG